MTDRIYLECHDDEQNKRRFYQMFIMKGLFDEWSLLREWGRVGSPGTVKKDWFETQQQADSARTMITQQKIKKGEIIPIY